MSKASPLIAIVDDEEPIRIALRRLLRSSGFNVELHAGGAEFLASLKTHRPDCLILDLHMPRISGFTVQTRLEEAGIRLPVVVITGHDSDEAQARAIAAGVSSYIRKPIDEKILIEAITAAIAKGPRTTGLAAKKI